MAGGRRGKDDIKQNTLVPLSLAICSSYNFTFKRRRQGGGGRREAGGMQGGLRQGRVKERGETAEREAAVDAEGRQGRVRQGGGEWSQGRVRQGGSGMEAGQSEAGWGG